MKPHIVVIGSTNTDMIIKVPHLPLPGETVLGGKFTVAQGGKGANQAVAAARAGGRVSFISCLGNDLFGKKSLEELAKDGIDLSGIKIVEGFSSGVALINVSEIGENCISVAPGANSQLFPEDIEKAAQIIKSADLVLIQLEIPLETVEKAIQVAKSEKIPIILNPAPGRLLDKALLKMVDFITPNENEAFLLAQISETKPDNETLCKALKDKGSAAVILTLGENGAFISTNDLEEHIPGYKVNAIDATAAGDTFNGYLAVSIARGDELKCAVSLANKAASIAVTRLGAQPSIPLHAEIDIAVAASTG
jgi:ribokinase